MNKIKLALKKRQDYDPNAYYLFLIKKSEDGKKACPTTGGNGIMPFNRHFGFIFLENDKNLSSNPEKLQHTIAHELEHGAFTLYHTFSSKDKSIPQGNTQPYGLSVGGWTSYNKTTQQFAPQISMAYHS